MKKEYSKIYVILLAINVTCLIISNIISIKTVSVGSIMIVASNFLFPITYILDDVFSEIYGYKKAREVIWISFFCNLFATIMFELTIFLPSSQEFKYQNEIEIVLGNSLRMLIASFLAFLVGNFSNAMVLSKLKVKTKGKYLALRTILSTIVGEGLDSLVFIPIAFAGTVSNSSLIILILNVFVIKVLFEVIFTPVTYKVINFIKKKENIDTYDNDIKYKII